MRRLPSPPRRVTALLALTTLTSLAACGGDGTGTDPDPDPSISVSVAPASLSVEQGESGSTTVSVTRSGGFTGPVTVTPSGLPSGVSAPPVTVPAGAGSTELTFTAASDAATGTTDVTLSATGQGVSASATVELEVTEAPGGGFELALDPSSVTVDEVPAPAAAEPAGAEPAAAPDATVTVMITRQDPFDGPVELSVTDAPDDLATDLAETSVSGTETTLTVEAMAGLAPGSYTVTVSGSAEGVTDASAELEVVVEESDGGGDGGGAFTVQVCDAAWFAVKDGDDPWMRVDPGGAGDEYGFDVEAQRLGMAWVQERDLPGGVGETRSVDIFFLDRDEVALFQDPCTTVSEGKTVTGTVTGFGGADFATVQLGFISGSVVPAAPSFTLEGIPDGERHLLVTRATQDAGTGNLDVDRMIVRRNQNLPDGTDLDLDFGASEAFDLGNAQVTLSGLGAEEHVFSAGFVPTGSFFASVGTGSLGVRVDPTSPVSIPVVPAANRQAGDLHALLLGGEGRAVFEYHAEPAGQTVELGPALTAPTVTTTTVGQAVFPSGAFASQAEYDEWWSLTFSQSSGFTGVDVELFATEAYLNGDPPELGVPDLTSVDGWDDAWNLVPGTEITWDASAAEGLLDFVFPEDGDVVRVGTAEGTINP